MRDYLFAPGLPLHAIISEVADKYGLTYAEIISERRCRRVAWPRQEAMWRCAKETTASYPQIAREFLKDHTTVLHGIRRHEERMRGCQEKTVAVISMRPSVRLIESGPAKESY